MDLKQSLRVWFERFSQAMQNFGYKHSQVDHTLFIKHLSHGKVTTSIVYLGDIVLTGTDNAEIHKQRFV